MMKQYSEETLKRAKALFPINYDLHDLILKNNEDALTIIRNMDINPFIHVSEIVDAFEGNIMYAFDSDNHWGSIALYRKAERIRNIIALEELMMDEMDILEINNEK